ncbi:hypothetical protein AA0119_g11523 [Alternaria tenuissima]|uniref:Uncharacterized protein n=2 Tax=Alternaria alternata complex TaxID=187734 RepID=A0A4Q4MZU5_ALTAL|nr:hypothetical protein AA0117_g12265 [Alternaria alternata]RYN89248.1 hypothetical protein AA0119_g11523 [Alternaria tenuissima]RYO04900.1 hypothetical protein AA0121_g12616 [Alternaria tenuissima]RYO48062.1 hypothetical protein AA0116_g12786 [Alternaria tenuissima]
MQHPAFIVTIVRKENDTLHHDDEDDMETPVYGPRHDDPCAWRETSLSNDESSRLTAGEGFFG